MLTSRLVVHNTYNLIQHIYMYKKIDTYNRCLFYWY